jgi:hypothetical protein
VEGITGRLTAPLDGDINLIYGLLCELFEHAAICFLFCVFHRLTHILMRASDDAGKLPAQINVVHWIILVLIVVMSIADFALWVVVDFSFLVLDGDYRPVEITRSVLIWLASWEITAWAVVLLIQAKRTPIPQVFSYSYHPLLRNGTNVNRDLQLLCSVAVLPFLR